MFPVQGKSPPVQVKEPYGNLDMVSFSPSSCNPECYKVHTVPANNAIEGIMQAVYGDRVCTQNMLPARMTLFTPTRYTVAVNIIGAYHESLVL